MDLIDTFIPKTYIAIVLDKSGSMYKGRDVTISGFNEQVQTIKLNSTDMDTSISLITFNHEAEEVLFNMPVDTLQEITRENYEPSGCTAMYDAVGYTINRLETLSDIKSENTAVLVIIISDGEENSSKNFNSKQIAERVKELQDTGRWTFTYMGANQDLTKVAETMNLYTVNTVSFNANSTEGYQDAFRTNTSATTRYMNTRRAGGMSVQTFYSDLEEDTVE